MALGPVVDLHARQRQRWHALALAEAQAADWADEPHIAAAFRVVAVTIEVDRAVDPPLHGRTVLKGRQAAYDRALELGSAGLSSRAVAAAVEQPFTTVYNWLRKAGLVEPRTQWRRRVKRRAGR